MPKPQITGWFRRLDNGRLEIFLKVQGADTADRKIRASGPAMEMNELADWFEEKTGLRVEATWRTVRRGPKVMEGQMALGMGEVPPETTLDELTEEVYGDGDSDG